MPCLSDHRGATSYGVLLGMLMTVGISAGMTNVGEHVLRWRRWPQPGESAVW